MERSDTVQYRVAEQRIFRPLKQYELDARHILTDDGEMHQLFQFDIQFKWMTDSTIRLTRQAVSARTKRMECIAHGVTEIEK